MRRRTGAVITGVLLGLLAIPGCTPAEPPPPPAQSLAFDFDDAATPLGVTGQLAQGATIREVATNDGSLTFVDSYPGAGQAMQLPAFDPGETGKHAVLEVIPGADDLLNPGAEPVSISADINLATGQSESDQGSDNGDNIIQRGLFDAPAQIKLQADHDVASCRVRGTDGEVVVRSKVKLKRGSWYRVSCIRDGDAVTISVAPIVGGNVGEAVEVTEQGVTGAIDFEPRVPLSIGGKVNDDGTVTAKSSDAFNGLIDNVVVSIG